jgi:hypothetical protein
MRGKLSSTGALKQGKNSASARDCRHTAHNGVYAWPCITERTGSSPTPSAAARASAHMYSLVQTARANDLEPYAYLRRLFTELPAAQTVEQIEALLPWNIKS